jgi:hypothetical protein
MANEDQQPCLAAVSIDALTGALKRSAALSIPFRETDRAGTA